MGEQLKTWTIRDFAQLEALCKIQCSKADICAVMDVAEKTLDWLVKEKYGKMVEKMQDYFRACAERRCCGRSSSSPSAIPLWRSG